VAPGYAAGFYQINAVIPSGVSAGNDYLDILTPEAEAEQVTLNIGTPVSVSAPKTVHGTPWGDRPAGTAAPTRFQRSTAGAARFAVESAHAWIPGLLDDRHGGAAPDDSAWRSSARGSVNAGSPSNVWANRSADGWWSRFTSTIGWRFRPGV